MPNAIICHFGSSIIAFAQEYQTIKYDTKLQLWGT